MIEERLAPVVSGARDLQDRFARAGFDLYLVGGIVRDAVMNRLDDRLDVDFTTNAKPDDIEKICRPWADAIWTQGKRFGTIALLKGGQRIEITTHRGEYYEPDSRKPRVEFSDSVEVDLSRRDFTINAMAVRLRDLRLFDPFGGLEDLVSRTLRTPLTAAQSFEDDPLRMLRAIRFVGLLGLTPVEELFEAIQSHRSRLGIISAERIRDEFDKIMVLDDPSRSLELLIETKLAQEFVPEFPALALERDPLHHHKDVLAHTIAVVQRASPDRILRLAAFFHDIGKPATRAFVGGKVTFHHHDVVGARMTRKRMRVLKYSTEDIEAVSHLVALHLRFHTYEMGWTDAAIRRYVRDAGVQLWRLNELTRCDCTTQNKRKAEGFARKMNEFEQKIAELRAREEIDALRPDLDGNEVMQLLGLSPGKHVGQALEFLMQIRLDEGSIGKEQATERLRAWWEEQDSSS